MSLLSGNLITRSTSVVNCRSSRDSREVPAELLIWLRVSQSGRSIDLDVETLYLNATFDR